MTVECTKHLYLGLPGDESETVDFVEELHCVSCHVPFLISSLPNASEQPSYQSQSVQPRRVSLNEPFRFKEEITMRGWLSYVSAAFGQSRRTTVSNALWTCKAPL